MSFEVAMAGPLLALRGGETCSRPNFYSRLDHSMYFPVDKLEDFVGIRCWLYIALIAAKHTIYPSGWCKMI